MKLTCSKCGETKALEDFPKDKRNTGRHGRNSWCKECKAAYQRNYEKGHPDRWRRWACVNREHLRNYQRKWRRAHPDYVRNDSNRRRRANPKASREYLRKWHKEHPERNAEYKRRWRREHPLKARANESVARSVRLGKIKKPDFCSSCGQVCEPIDLHGHHEDYANPLGVKWLCRECHNEIHTERKQT